MPDLNNLSMKISDCPDCQDYVLGASPIKPSHYKPVKSVAINTERKLKFYTQL